MLGATARRAERQVGYEHGGIISQQCYSITKLIYFWVLEGLLYKLAVYRLSEKLHGPLGATCTMMCLHTYAEACVGHVMQRDMGCIHDETSGVSVMTRSALGPEPVPAPAQPRADPLTFCHKCDPHRVASHGPLYSGASAYAHKCVMVHAAPSGLCIFPLSL